MSPYCLLKANVAVLKSEANFFSSPSYVRGTWLPQNSSSVKSYKCTRSILQNTTSLKLARKVHETLRRIIAGLLVNQEMTAESILLLSYGLVSENLPLLTEKEK